jgi:hypothetical protein
MKNYNDSLEKILTAIFGGLGVIAILINLHLKRYGIQNLMDSLKDMAGLVVVLAVFIITNKFYKRNKFDFTKAFEENLRELIKRNDYLISDENLDHDGKGNLKKRYCSMVIDHSNIVTGMKKARSSTAKGAFVYLPYLDQLGNLKNEFDFRFNISTFQRQEIYKTPEGKVNLKSIIEQIAKRIDENFGDINIVVTPKPSQDTIIVSFENMQKNEHNARKLVEIVDFVKTLVLALA